jgi:hypothetical protein
MPYNYGIDQEIVVYIQWSFTQPEGKMTPCGLK